MINLKISGPSGFRRMMPSAAEIWTGIDEASDDVDRRCWIEWCACMAGHPKLNKNLSFSVFSEGSSHGGCPGSPLMRCRIVFPALFILFFSFPRFSIFFAIRDGCLIEHHRQRWNKFMNFQAILLAYLKAKVDAVCVCIALDIDGRCHGIKHLMFGGISGFILFHFATHHFFLIESGNQDMLDALFVCKSLVAAKLEIKACGMKCSFKVGHISERNYAGSVISFGELLMWKIDQILLEMECKFGEKEEKQKEKGRGGDIGPPNPNHVRLFVVFRKICKLKKAERSALWG
ncbi:hypothetical protein V6N13_052521 [Hibiscus sabdariffa]